MEASEDGLPKRVRLGSAWSEVEMARSPWRIDQEWWRGEGISRTYYRVAPTDGPPLTIYQDIVTGAWFRQEY